MKRFLATICLFISLATSGLVAQNIQLHYDFGKSLYNELDARPILTSTIEYFRPDGLGNTFFFVDMNYASSGVTSAYMEIFREFTLSKSCPINLHIEYNGGIIKGLVENNLFLNNAYLVGAAYNFHSKDYTKGGALTVMYKYLQKHNSPQSFQLTGTWYLHLFQSKLTLCGFADLWREETQYGKLIFLSEPQFWLNLNAFRGIDDKFKFSIGSEIKLSHNFEGRDGFYCIPTLAVKWTF